MKIRIYQLIDPVLCGSPKPGFFDVPEVSPYFYSCELISNDNLPKANVDKIGYHDHVILPAHFPVQESDLRSLESFLNNQKKFLSASELSHHAYMHLKTQFYADVTAKKPADIERAKKPGNM